MLKPKKTIKADTSINYMVLKLLTIVPKFQRDLEKVRREFNIKDGGIKWLSKEMNVWSLENKMDYYQLESDHNGEIEGSTNYKSNEAVMKSFPSNLFEKKLLGLGLKYRLPFNFYAFPYTGIARFILNNEIKTPPSNYDISFNVNEDNFSWASLIIYAPPTKEELKEINNELNYKFEMIKGFSSGRDIIFKNKNKHKTFDRSIELLVKEEEENKKPKTAEIAKEDSYPHRRIKENPDITEKQIRQLKKDHPNSFKVVKQNKKTTKQLGEKISVSGETVRQSKIRLNSLAKELFGYDLEL